MRQYSMFRLCTANSSKCAPTLRETVKDNSQAHKLKITTLKLKFK